MSVDPLLLLDVAFEDVVGFVVGFSVVAPHGGEITLRHQHVDVPGSKHFKRGGEYFALKNRCLSLFSLLMEDLG